MNCKFLDEQERARRTRAFMRSVHTKEQVMAKPVETPELAENSLKVLIKALLEPGLFLLAIYAALGLHPAEGKAAVTELIARGFARPHRFPRKGRGGQPQALEPLPKGIEELAKRGITPPPRKIARGGWKHDVFARWLENWARTRSFHHWFERRLGKKFFDFVYEDGAGELHGIEVCLSGTARWNAEQAFKAASVEGVARVVVACERQSFVDAITTELKEVDGLGLYRNKIVATLLTEFSA